MQDGVKHFSLTQEAKEPFEEGQETSPAAAPHAVPPPATDLPDETIELSAQQVTRHP